MPATCRVLIAGESWTTHSVHQKGFDSFTTTEYAEGVGWLKTALLEGGWQVDYQPSHVAARDFPSCPIKAIAPCPSGGITDKDRCAQGAALQRLPRSLGDRTNGRFFRSSLFRAALDRSSSRLGIVGFKRCNSLSRDWLLTF